MLFINTCTFGWRQQLWMPKYILDLHFTATQCCLHRHFYNVLKFNDRGKDVRAKMGIRQASNAVRTVRLCSDETRAALQSTYQLDMDWRTTECFQRLISTSSVSTHYCCKHFNIMFANILLHTSNTTFNSFHFLTGLFLFSFFFHLLMVSLFWCMVLDEAGDLVLAWSYISCHYRNLDAGPYSVSKQIEQV